MLLDAPRGFALPAQPVTVGASFPSWTESEAAYSQGNAVKY